jgi:REP element-mobilizing transposase RayT
MSSQRRRKNPLRLPGYDYAAAGAYFVTICTHERAHLFGTVTDDAMVLNTLGHVIETCWDDLPNHYHHIALDAFVVMPNHVHGIIIISDDGVGEGFKPSPTTNQPAPTKRHDLPEIVRGFKTFSARWINALRATPGMPVWQRGYHDHIIRDPPDLDRLRAYIATNPARWHEDSLYT